mgnify:CR=1 FL=1
MKKDINIPQSKDVHIAIVLEEHPEYHTMDWNAYIINSGDTPVEMAIIVSKGFSDKKITGEFRHQVKLLPAQGYAKIEFIEKKLLDIDNQFSVTYFRDNQLFDKTFLFKAKSIKESNLENIPVMNSKGVVAN